MPDTDSTTNEIWKPVVGYEGTYEVSNLGRMRRIAGWLAGSGGYVHPPAIAKAYLNKVTGYLCVNLRKNKTPRSFRLHTLVAAAFIGVRPTGFDVNHIDGDKTNNRAENLEYLTRSQNQLHSYAAGIRSDQGEGHPFSKLTEEKLLQIRSMLAKGKGPTAIGREFGISHATVCDIKSGKTWKHIGHGSISPKVPRKRMGL